MFGYTNESGCLSPAVPPEPRFVRSRTVVSRVVGGETLIVPVRGKVGDLASIYSFNGTGSLIWQLLESRRPLSDLIDAVEREYEVGREQAKTDVTTFVNEMLSAELLDLCPPDAMGAMEPQTNQQTLETAGSR
jgi:Coenzyme PQQ synthesis protein D (PqqD)